MPRILRPRSKVGAAIHLRMEEIGLTPRQLAEETEVVYETIRKAITGDQPPSKKLLRDICVVLGLEFEELYAVQVEEKLQSKFPKALAKLAKRDPELLPIEERWRLLTTEQKEHIILLAKSYASENLLKKKSSARSYQSRFEITKPRVRPDR
jgi:transcriptional regulator with XRE-family HTH domain